ncbi:Hypothetical_protein [Hexamita inflata]|uniref:Hypothetical_protein n=1 Tax=Hexamita inflata TaxID=28002 RepID=A0AA86PQQ5_9EUKA|nr:Hypothetical protein HINF_LOCUS30763 [Hexamita inflata]
MCQSNNKYRAPPSHLESGCSLNMQLRQTFPQYEDLISSGSTRFKLSLNILISVIIKKQEFFVVHLKQLKQLLQLFQQYQGANNLQLSFILAVLILQLGQIRNALGS